MTSGIGLESGCRSCDTSRAQRIQITINNGLMRDTFYFILKLSAQTMCTHRDVLCGIDITLKNKAIT